MFSLAAAAGAADDLTPLGAERARNAAGTIPYTVDASNAEGYAQYLSEGERALLEK